MNIIGRLVRFRDEDPYVSRAGLRFWTRPLSKVSANLSHNHVGHNRHPALEVTLK